MAPSCLLNFCVKLKYNYIMFPLPFLPPTTPTHTHALSQILSPVLKIPHLPVFFLIVGLGSLGDFLLPF